MKQQNQSEASRNAHERGEPTKNSNSQMNDPRARQWYNYEKKEVKNQPLSHPPKRDMTGERKDIDE